MLGNRLKLAITSLVTLILVSLTSNIFAYQYPYPHELSSDSVLLMDVNNNQIVYSQNIHQRFQPASLAKIMTLFLIFDVLKQETFHLNDEIVISKIAAQKKGSTMYLREGEKVSIDELIKGIAVVSGNDACVAIAEGIFGSEQNLIEKMNQKLLDLNLQNSKFQTVDGWPDPEQYTTAFDMMILTHAYIHKYPEVIPYHKLKQFTHSNIVLHNRNGLIFQDPSVDGLKTGHVEESGYHLIATATRENQRYIAILMGAKEIEAREKEAIQLLNFGFNDLINITLFNKDDVLSHLSVLKGVNDKVGIKPLDDGVITIPANLKEFITYEIVPSKQQEAPITINQQLGEVTISYNKEILKTIPLVATENIQQAAILEAQIKEPKKPNVIGLKYILLFVFILICVLGLLYLFIKGIPLRFNKTDSIEAERVKERLDRLFEPDKKE